MNICNIWWSSCGMIKNRIYEVPNTIIQDGDVEVDSDYFCRTLVKLKSRITTLFIQDNTYDYKRRNKRTVAKH